MHILEIDQDIADRTQNQFATSINSNRELVLSGQKRGEVHSNSIND